MSDFVEGGHDFFNLFKGGYFLKSLGNPDLECFNSVLKVQIASDIVHKFLARFYFY